MIEENNYIQFKTLNNECVTNLYTKKPFNMLATGLKSMDFSP